jgi:glycosyltransferase involved in cell wall biosynthesis
MSARLGADRGNAEQGSELRIAANLGIKDEVELIEQAIAHLRRIGVDLIIACDNGSTDGTVEILDRYRCEETFWVAQFDDLEPIDIWLQRNVELVKKAEADWIIFLDVDEFWLPASGNLKECADLADADVLTVDRFNVPLSQAGVVPVDFVPEKYDELLLIADPIRDFRTRLKEDDSLPWIMSPRGRKVMARPKLIAGLHVGMHDIVPSDSTSLRRCTPKDLLIAHLPFTTWTRFERKIRNVRRVFAVHDAYFGPDLAWHWRRWLAVDDRGQLQDEFDHQIFDAEEMAEFRRTGVIRSAAELFRQRAT